MRQDRFNPKVPIVTQTEFYKANFLKHYDKVPKDPSFSSVIESLKELDDDDGDGDFSDLIDRLESLSEEDDVIRTYSSEIEVGVKHFYTYVNEQLCKDDNSTVSKLMPLIRRATHQINYKAPKNACVVYRGIDLNDSYKKYFKVGTIFRFPGFTSTSLSREKAETFGDTLFKIKIYSGCLQVRDLSKISDFPEEEEYLFSPYSLFEVTEKNDEMITLKAHDNLEKIGMDIKLPKVQDD
ncbi:unnamed protein product [Rotaria socialis]|uniref:NAD(P)(+)--arginine ADP-ribosyltransferase n=1 Tax=Rotaria socialis TaxID=392032 RepID=A0A821JZJ6_9BILA|nr:unnamed protein product [Rotaria socialis]CAF4729675.1 unnamed protein product [Rotaria socialis]